MNTEISNSYDGTTNILTEDTSLVEHHKTPTFNKTSNKLSSKLQFTDENLNILSKSDANAKIEFSQLLPKKKKSEKFPLRMKVNSGRIKSQPEIKTKSLFNSQSPISSELDPQFDYFESMQRIAKPKSILARLKLSHENKSNRFNTNSASQRGNSNRKSTLRKAFQSEIHTILSKQFNPDENDLKEGNVIHSQASATLLAGLAHDSVKVAQQLQRLRSYSTQEKNYPLSPKYENTAFKPKSKGFFNKSRERDYITESLILNSRLSDSKRIQYLLRLQEEKKEIYGMKFQDYESIINLAKHEFGGLGLSSIPEATIMFQEMKNGIIMDQDKVMNFHRKTRSTTYKVIQSDFFVHPRKSSHTLLSLNKNKNKNKSKETPPSI